jgi:hypothetical protein
MDDKQNLDNKSNNTNNTNNKGKGKKIFKSILKIIEQTADRITIIIFAILFIQFPQFIVQYKQRLGGHVDELAIIIQQYKEVASLNGRSLQEYINLFLDSGISEFVNTGEMMNLNLQRLDYLSSALNDLMSSTGFAQFFTFIRTMDYPIFQTTLTNFTPGFAFNFETLIYVFVGAITGFVIFSAIKKFIYLIFRIKTK